MLKITTLSLSLSLAALCGACGSSPEAAAIPLGGACEDTTGCAAGLLCTDTSASALNSQCRTLTTPVCSAPKLGCVCRVSTPRTGPEPSPTASLVCSD